MNHNLTNKDFSIGEQVRYFISGPSIVLKQDSLASAIATVVGKATTYLIIGWKSAPATYAMNQKPGAVSMRGFSFFQTIYPYAIEKI
jgi:hypothetical protein